MTGLSRCITSLGQVLHAALAFQSLLALAVVDLLQDEQAGGCALRGVGAEVEPRLLEVVVALFVLGVGPVFSHPILVVGVHVEAPEEGDGADDTEHTVEEAPGLAVHVGAVGLVPTICDAHVRAPSCSDP
jgi:hypothetical protein